LILAVYASAHGYVGAADFNEFTASEAYCRADAIFVGVATKAYFVRPDGDSCQALRAPKTVAEFAAQQTICYPFIVEVTVKELLHSTQPKPRPAFRLHMKFAPPDSRSDSIAQLTHRLQASPHIYAVAFLPAYERDGYTWLLGYPRSTEELGYLRSVRGKPQCDIKR
jgi:hypothetical protein